MLTLAWVCIQGAFGALTVTMKLYPAIVTLHLMGGFVLLALLSVQAVRLSPQGLIAQWPSMSPTLRWWLWCGLWLLMVQVALGGWVSTNYAVLACTEFPQCQGSWWPPMAFDEGFQVWRHLGLRADGTPIAFSALTAIHMVHRMGAAVLVPVLLGVAWALYRTPAMQTHARWLIALLLAQVVTGLSNVLLQWPLATAVLHTAGAAGLLLTLVWTLAASQTQATGPLTVWQQYHALTKPRVIQLIVFCALIGMVLAVPGVPTMTEVWRALLACIGIYLVAGAAAAFNCLIEKGIDAKMKRTAWRPTAQGQLSDLQALAFSALLCTVGSAILYVWINPLTMWLTFATFVGYAIIYTVILKPMTPQNIVIGGASGAMPPVLGWAAMTADVQPPALILFLIIFVWTPPHFWALALYRVEDYRKSGLPMLPVTHGSAFTRLQILLYTFVLLAACLLPFVYGMSGWLYLVVATGLCVGFCVYAWQLWRDYSDALARKTFRFSLIHLSVLFAVLLVDHYIA
jgi:protoheme IX farnesyltransferase